MNGIKICRRPGMWAAILSASGILFPAFGIPTPWLHTDGRWIKDPNGNVVILRGADLPGLEEMNGNRGSSMNVSSMIDTLTNAANGWYARVLRLCVDPEPFFANEDGYFNNNIKPALDACVSHGVYCIVDLHYVATADSVSANVVKFWTYVAPKIKTYSNVILEIMNEDSDNETWSQWKNGYAQPWYDAVRALAPQNLILIGGPQWNTTLGGSATDPVVGTNIFYCAHFYPQSNSQLWGPNGAVTAAARVVPFFISEWGYIQGGAIPTSGTQSSFGDPFKIWLSQMQIGWSAWCADNVWDPKMFDPNWNLLTGQNYEGGFVKQFLADTRDSALPSNATAIRPLRAAASSVRLSAWLELNGGITVDGRHKVRGWNTAGSEMLVLPVSAEPAATSTEPK